MLSNGMLGFYILLSLLVLFGFYRASGQKMVSEAQAREAEIKRLATLEKEYAGRLTDLGPGAEHAIHGDSPGKKQAG